MGDNNSKDTIFCTECNVEIPKINKFCSQCGKPVKVEQEKEQESGEFICPKCHVEVGPGLKFCTDCGTKILESGRGDQPGTCPKCHADVSPDLKFCTECGTSLQEKRPVTSAEINERLRQKRESGEYGPLIKDENVDLIVESGKGLMKGLGGIFNQAKEDFDSMAKSATNSNNGETRPMIKKENSLGFLVCDKCSGVYQLEPGESADDFVLKCGCGGKLEYQKSLDE